MIRIKYLFITILLCSALIACDSKKDSLIVEKSNIEVKALPKTLKSSSVVAKATQSPELETILTTDDIISYNGRTGEIIFKNITKKGEKPYDVLGSFYNKYDDNLEFYKDRELLFKLEGVVTDATSAMYNTPVLYYNIGEFDKKNSYKFFILDGYGGGLPLSKYKQSKFKERIANVEKILPGWNIFIESLKKEGKYIE